MIESEFFPTFIHGPVDLHPSLREEMPACKPRELLAETCIYQPFMIGFAAWNFF